MATITLTDKDGIQFDVDADKITSVKALNPLAVLAHNARTMVGIEGISGVMVREEDYIVLGMIAMNREET